MKVFISGKYGSHDLPSEIRLANTMKAIEAGRNLIKMGHDPFIPHLSHWVHDGWGWDGSTAELWYEIDLRWLECCDAILMLEGWGDSVGAQREHKYARQWLGIPVYYAIEDVPSGL